MSEDNNIPKFNPELRTEDRNAMLTPSYSAKFRSFPLTQTDVDDLAEHTRVSPEATREALIELINTIPDEELSKTYGAQITLVC